MKEAATEIRAEAGKAGGEINTLIEYLEKNNPGVTNTIRSIGDAISEFESNPEVQELEQEAAEIPW